MQHLYELRVVDPCADHVAVRLKLTKGALGIADIYVSGAWKLRTTWDVFAGFGFEEIPGPLAEELAERVHAYIEAEAASKRARRRRGKRVVA